MRSFYPAPAGKICGGQSFTIGQLTDVYRCKLQQHFSCNRCRAFLRNLMNAIAPARTAELHQWRVPLTAVPTAAAEARKQVRAAIWAWDITVDVAVATLLTSELVTNAIMHTATQTVTLGIAAVGGKLRVDVYDASRSLPVVVDAAPDAEAGRGLKLVATLSDEWGFYRTPSGKAVYFALRFQPGR
jgi:anti-sigma regulatory factor (Ser/Thr protein kinase)